MPVEEEERQPGHHAGQGDEDHQQHPGQLGERVARSEIVESVAPDYEGRDADADGVEADPISAIEEAIVPAVSATTASITL